VLSDPRARTLASLALLMVSGVLFVLGCVALYARAELVDERSFAERAVGALENDDVRRVVAEQIVSEIIDQGASDLLTVRPLLASAVTALLDTPQFEELFAEAVRDAHSVFLERGDGDLVIDLANAGTLVAEGLASVSPDIAADLPDDLRPQVAELRESDFAAQVVRTGDQLRLLGVVLPLLALAGFAAAIAIAPVRRAAVTGAGVAVASSGAAVAMGLLAWRALIVDSVQQSGLLESDDVRAAVGAAWDAYLGDLRLWAFGAVGFGLVLIAVGGTGVHPSGALALVRGGVERVLVRPASRPARAARALAALSFGALLIVRPSLALEAGGLLAGVLLVLFGVDELVAAIERARAEPAGSGALRRRALAGLAGAAGVVALGLAVVGVAGALRSDADDGAGTGAGRSGEGESRAVEEAACNGSPALCDRRLNQVVFAGTHNSFSAAREPGWLFANQREGIASQLEDGIRALLLDPHYGVPSSRGRIRTDLAAEGVSRNRVARELSPRALAIADRLTGRVGFGEPAGELGLYMCHTLCELGAEPMVEELEAIGGFLDDNPREVLVVFVEPYVPAEDVEAAFREGGLLDELVTLRRDEPLPTLGELVDSGRRLVVFTEGDDAGTPAWYHPLFSFFQDTPIGSTERGGCQENRGDENNALLALNNWADGFPPSPSRNRAVGRRAFIMNRVRSCRRSRGLAPNVIAVDFHDTSDVVEVADALNGRFERP
jgi:hypothetical protein